MLLSRLAERPTLFFGGKGGVGKTTCSAAVALALSEQGRRVLLVSTDPAHSTSDIFEKSIGSIERELKPGLWALEIDAQAEAARYIRAVKQDIERMFSASVIRQAHKQIEMAAASPGLVEVAMLDRMIDLIVDRERSYDSIIFDTAPTGHTLQLLRMPEAMTAWIQALVRHRRVLLEMERGSDEPVSAVLAEDPVLAALERRRQRLEELRNTIVDRSRTSFVLVTIPERLAIEETARAAEVLSETALTVGGLIVNRVLPDNLEGEFYQSRKSQEVIYLDEIATRFAKLPRAIVRQLPRDVYGVASLALVADQLRN
jgi:arsenite-transporting ATPase